MLVKKIFITERKDKLKIKIQLKADFRAHIDFLHNEDSSMYKSYGDILVVENFHKKANEYLKKVLIYDIIRSILKASKINARVLCYISYCLYQTSLITRK